MLHDPNENALFPKLPEEALHKMQKVGAKIHLNAGDTVFTEGQADYKFCIVLDGEIEITKQLGGERKLLAVHRRGEFMGEVSMLTGHGASASARALTNATVLEIDSETFKRIIAECSPIADVILTAMVGRSKDVEVQMRHSEKLAALGKLSAGLAHELNNPAAAAQRASSNLREISKTLQSLMCELYSLSQEQLKFLRDFELQANPTIKLDPLDQSDKEDAVTDWLEDHDIKNSWKMAPTFVNTAIDTDKLDNLADQIPQDKLEIVLHWLEAKLAQTCLLNQIEQSTARISEIVQAVKGYSYMDQAPLQEIDVHQGIENTLIIFGHKLKKGIAVKREYDLTLPRIQAYGSELNQVWTNLIDNAIDAMKGKGQLTIRTESDNTCILVEITDTGTGIPEAIQPRIFEPFFTTKEMGAGTGLGLDITYRIIVKKHHGDIHFVSKPGNTSFRIYLPINPSEKTKCER
ncbi:sensor histidine kinase [Dulcicalothrix desertica PCC 7102]|uniref:histidine kinase n=1 Tax=Dulcicalothrix desertica PCC 7102 TaxID=232991 RepID=A0A433VTS4_9CYAN|nr:ATP-binding protein [Dulcicalothrix desertica]RUT09528.1 sensor histidine kinase [Dulcicalothrix desertica PCC 7102]TWH50725.1 histidine kinase/DNA gyrase B/HSP90-like ATPase [Dulcicalothrix desertica PCC 7102]